MTEVEEIVALWREERTPLNAGATEAALARLEQLLGVPLPKDVRAFYSLADGMPDDHYDACQLSFWSIERIVRERAAEAPAEPAPGRGIAFADVIAETHYDYYRRTAAAAGRITGIDSPSGLTEPVDERPA